MTNPIILDQRSLLGRLCGLSAEARQCPQITMIEVANLEICPHLLLGGGEAGNPLRLCAIGAFSRRGVVVAALVLFSETPGPKERIVPARTVATIGGYHSYGLLRTPRPGVRMGARTVHSRISHVLRESVVTTSTQRALSF